MLRASSSRLATRTPDRVSSQLRSQRCCSASARCALRVAGASRRLPPSAVSRPCSSTSISTDGGAGMKWVTRERPKTDRIACPWLIKNFIDPEAEFLYVPADQVLDVAEREGAHSYDAPEAEYTHRDGLCSFEVLLQEYAIDDAALARLARIVHGADVADDRDATPQSRGLLAVAEGFHLLDLGDHRQLELSLPVYDALYAWCKNEAARNGEPT